MKFDFRKIVSAATSAVLISSTVALAAAANYPAPFVENGSADVAVVYGSNGLDIGSVVDITADLQSELAKQTATSSSGGTGSSVSGEAYALFSSGDNKIWHNASLNTEKDTVTDTELPTVLADTDFSGNVDADLTHTILIGPNPRVRYIKQPTSDDDPQFGVALSTTSTNYLYNATVSFDKAVNFTHPDSEGETVTLFGQEFTVGSATDATDLVLFRQSKTLFLSSDANPSETVTVEGKEYTVELASATDTSATIKVTDGSGKTDQKEINEAASKKILGIEVGVNIADESDALNRLTAEVIVGAEKVTMTNGNQVLIGADQDAIEGTSVQFNKGAGTGVVSAGITDVTIQIAADDSDRDAILEGESLIDPVYGTFKVQLSDMANDDDREDIRVKVSSDDKMTVEFTNHQGNMKSLNWVYNDTATTPHPGLAIKQSANQFGIPFLGDSSGDAIHVHEMARVNKSEYIVIGNEDKGYLLEVSTITNSDSGFNNDKITFKNAFDTSETFDTSITAKGVGTVSIGGASYTVNYGNYTAASSAESRAEWVTINDPSSTGNAVNIFPTIETSKGAKVAFYQPTRLNLSRFDYGVTGLAAYGANNVSSLNFPDGDGYTAQAVVGTTTTGNWTIGGTTVSTDGLMEAASANWTNFTIGRLNYSVSVPETAAVNDIVHIYLQDPNGGNIEVPALIVFEEQSNDDNYEVNIVLLEGVGTDADGLGVNTVRTTRSLGSFITHESDSDFTSYASIFGTISTMDNSESDQSTVTISYPDDQLNAEVYVAEVSAAISAGSSGGSSVTELGSVSVADSEVSSVSTKNLIVVGGSCVNSVAAELLGSSTPLCGADFTAATDVASGQFLIETFARTGGKVATLVAGYNLGDTTNAAKYLTTQTVDTTVGMKYVGTSATSAEMVTEATA